jgi:hypothetical protein
MVAISPLHCRRYGKSATHLHWISDASQARSWISSLADGRFVLQFYALSGRSRAPNCPTGRPVCCGSPLTPRPPELMVLNEPETSLHPDLLPALARLIVATAERSQVWVVSQRTG